MPDVATARAAQLLGERRARDPLRAWTPFPWQRRFVSSAAEEAWAIAANRVGKSDGICAEVASFVRFGTLNPLEIDRADTRHTPKVVWMVSLSNELSRTIIQAKLFTPPDQAPKPGTTPFIPPWEVENWHATNHELRLKCGCLIYFKSCDQGFMRFEGEGLDLVVFDEAPYKSVYQSATMRVAAGRRLWIRGAATLLPPEGMVGGISWLYQDKIVPFERGQTTPAELELFGASLHENTALDPREIARLVRAYPPGTVEHDIRILGKWRADIAGTRAYPNFDRRVHVRDDLGPASADPAVPLRFCVDWNWNPFGAVVLQRLVVNGRPLRRVLAEVRLDRGTVDQMGRRLIEMFPAHRAGALLFADATGRKHNEQTGRSNLDLIMEALTKAPYPVEARVPDSNPAVVDRLNAVNRVLRDPDGTLGVEVAGGCTELVTDLELVQRATGGGIRKSHDPKDPYWQRTAWTDALGYEVVHSDPVASQISDAAVGHKPGAGRHIPGPAYDFGGPRPAPAGLPTVIRT